MGDTARWKCRPFGPFLRPFLCRSEVSRIASCATEASTIMPQLSKKLLPGSLYCTHRFFLFLSFSLLERSFVPNVVMKKRGNIIVIDTRGDLSVGRIIRASARENLESIDCTCHTQLKRRNRRCLATLDKNDAEMRMQPFSAGVISRVPGKSFNETARDFSVGGARKSKNRFFLDAKPPRNAALRG